MAVGNKKSGFINIIDCSTKNVIRRIKSHSDDIYSLKYSKCGKKFLSSGVDHKLVIHDVENEYKKIKIMKKHCDQIQ